MERVAHINLTENQMANLERAMLKSEPISINISKDAILKEPNTYLLLTKRNILKLEKAFKTRTGTRLTLSKSNIVNNRRKVYKKEPAGDGIWGDIWRATKHLGGEVFDNVVKPLGNVLVEEAKKVGRKGAAKVAKVACDAAAGAAVASNPELVTFAPAMASACEAVGAAIEGNGCMCEDIQPLYKKKRGRPPKK